MTERPTAGRIEGLSQLTRKLRAFDADIGKDVKEINRAAAEEIATLARSKAPIGTEERDEHPGQLLLSVRAGSTLASGFVTVGGANIPYANPIHWGWPAHGIAPQPFLREAALEGEPAVVRQYEYGMQALIAKVGLA